MTDRQARMLATALGVVAAAILVNAKNADYQGFGFVFGLVAFLFCVGDYYNSCRDERREK